jgi:hypothetical protein
MDVSASARSLATLAVLGVLFVAGVAWAWSAVTEPFPDPAETPACVDEVYEAGSRLRPGDVLVNVMNSSGKEGLARTTSEALVRRGFGEGVRGNAQAVPGARGPQVWTSDPGSPAARLVAGYLGPNAHVVEKPTSQEGITVVVGNSFPGVVDGPRSVEVEEDTTVCSPYDPQVDG